MPHLYPVVIPGGQSVRGSSLGFHAYSLRVDNLSNQWLQEQTTLAWIPPYSLGTCLRLYGCAVALVLNASPTGQPQLQPIAGEYAAGFFSDEYRTEVAGVPVRQFTLVQTVSDLTQGPEPAFPPVGVDRLWADTSGNIHHLHSNGQDLTLIDPSNLGAQTIGGDLYGTIGLAKVGVLQGSSIGLADNASIIRPVLYADAANDVIFRPISTNGFYWQNLAAASNLMHLGNSGDWSIAGNGGIGAALTVGPAIVTQSGDLGVARSSSPTTGVVYFGNKGTNPNLFYDGNNFHLVAGNLFVEGSSGTVFLLNGNTWVASDGSNSFFQSANAGPLFLRMAAGVLVQNFNGSAYAPISASAFNVNSTRKSKEGIVQLADDGALARVLDSRASPVTFRWGWEERRERNARGPAPPHTPVLHDRQVGFVADDMQFVVPEAISWDSTSGEALGINYGALTAVLWGAVRNLDRRLKAIGG